MNQMAGVIKDAGLEPIPLIPKGRDDGLSKARFLEFVAPLIRSGYPVLAFGDLNGSDHALCIVGFRDVDLTNQQPKGAENQDLGIGYLYLHDDNLGPGVRFRVGETTSDTVRQVQLMIDGPERSRRHLQHQIRKSF